MVALAILALGLAGASPALANAIELVITRTDSVWGAGVINGTHVDFAYGPYTIEYDVYLRNWSTDVSRVQISAVLGVAGSGSLSGTSEAIVFGPSPTGGFGILFSNGDPTVNEPGTLTWSFASSVGGEPLARDPSSPGFKLGTLTVSAIFSIDLAVGVLRPGDEVLDAAGLPTSVSSAFSTTYSDGLDPNVPEPSTALLVGLGVGLLARRARRRATR